MHKQSLSLNRRAFIRLLIITIVVVLMFYIIGLYLNGVGIATVRSDLQSAMDKETSYIAGQIDRDVGNLAIQAQALANDKDLLHYVINNSTFSDYQRVAGITSIADKLLRIKRFSDLVESAEIFLPEADRVVITDQSFYNTMDQDEWHTLSSMLGQRQQRLIEHNGSAYLLSAQVWQNQPKYLLSIRISPDRLLQRATAMASDAALEVVLRRADGTLFTGTETGQQLLQNGQESGSLFDLPRDAYFVSTATIQRLQLELVCLSPAEAVMQPMLRHRMWVWVLTALAAILLVSCLVYYHFFILRPLNTIAATVKKAEKTGHFHIDASDADADDLYTQFNSMMEHMEDLTAQVYEERLRAQQSEIRQLQMQINPHFFYNTLFMVYRMAQAEGSDTIAQISLNLSNYYRYITKLPEHDVPLRDEVKHITNYLEIQRVRFAPRISVRIDPLPEEIAGEHIPPLILQPVVENAFVHGVKDKTSGGMVEVGFAHDDEHFRVTVYDNGGTMDEASVRSLDERIRSGQLPEGSALYNLYRRMELCYGDRYELRLQSVDGGLMVSIVFPRNGR